MAENNWLMLAGMYSFVKNEIAIPYLTLMSARFVDKPSVWQPK
jgi:hypothetical protein